MGIFGNATEALIEKATSETLVAGSEDLESSLQICDAIRSKQLSAKDAMTVFKKRLQHKSPSVHLLTLQLLDFVAKNGGSHFLVELASLQFTQFLSEYIKSPQCHFQVKEKALECIQIWGLGFSSKYELRSMTKLYETLKLEGFTFPPKPDISEDFFESQTPPDWGDSDVCMRCRDPFTLTNRKHHCRKCGETFCSDCSSKSKPLPHLGITKPVRVCDGCYDRMPGGTGVAVNGNTNSSSGGGSGGMGLYSASSPANMTSSQHRARVASHSSIFPANAGAVPVRILTPSYYMPTASPAPLDHDMNLAIRLSIEESQRTAAKKSEDDDPILAAAIAASLKETSYGSLEEASSSLTRAIESTSVAIDSTPASFSLTDREMIHRFADQVKRAERTREPIRQDLKDMYAQVYSLQAKLQREMDVTKEDFRKYVGIQQSFNEALRSYDSALDILENSSVHASESVPVSHPGMVSSSLYASDVGPSSSQAYAQPYASYHPPPQQQQQQQQQHQHQHQQQQYQPPVATTSATMTEVPAQQQPVYAPQTSQPMYTGQPQMSFSPMPSYPVYSQPQTQAPPEPAPIPDPSSSGYPYSMSMEQTSYTYQAHPELASNAHPHVTASAPNSYSPVPSHSVPSQTTAIATTTVPTASSQMHEPATVPLPQQPQPTPEEEKPLIEF